MRAFLPFCSVFRQIAFGTLPWVMPCIAPKNFNFFGCLIQFRRLKSVGKFCGALLAFCREACPAVGAKNFVFLVVLLTRQIWAVGKNGFKKTWLWKSFKTAFKRLWKCELFKIPCQNFCHREAGVPPCAVGVLRLPWGRAFSFSLSLFVLV